MRRRKRIRWLVFCLLLPLCCCMGACGPEKEKPEPPKTTDQPEVKDPEPEKAQYYGQDEILLSVFWPPSKGYTEQVQYDYLKEAHIDLLEWNSDPIFTDPETLEKTLALCEKNGIKITVCDESFGDGLRNKTEDEIRQIVEKYRQYESVVGFYIKDEPANANEYFPSVRTVAKYFPGAISQLNFLPFGAVPDYVGYIHDYASLSGGDASTVRYLSFDAYPFGLAEGSVPQMFANFDVLRKAGLLYGLDTAMYLQSIGVIGGFRKPTASETRYHASAALAYGFKNLKYFTWITPVERSEDFTDAIINPDGTKNGVFDSIVDINTSIKAVSRILGRTDALEIYHSGRVDNGTVMLGDDWHVKAVSKNDFLVSLMVDRYTGANYLLFVNKDFTNDAEISVTLSEAARAGGLTDLTGGPEAAKTVTAGENGEITLSVEAGGFSLLALGEKVRLQAEEPAGADPANYARGKAVYVSTSVGANGKFAYLLNDGVRISSDSALGWACRVGRGTDSAWATVDLGKSRTVNRVDLYPSGDPGEQDYGEKFPADFEIQYSEDRENWATAASVSDYTVTENRVPSFTFDAVTARYVRILIHADPEGSVRELQIAEMEVYYDDGSIPAPSVSLPDVSQFEGKENLALKKAVSASSSYESDGWGRKNLTDGILGGDAAHTGWTTMPGAHAGNPYAEAWCRIDLGESVSFDSLVFYPRQDGGKYFPKRFKVQVSEDGKTYTDVAEFEDTQPIGTHPRVVRLEEAAKGRYVRIMAEEMTEAEGARDGFMMQFAEIEIYQTK